MSFSLQASALKQLEQLFNSAVDLDPGTRIALRELAGRKIAIKLSFPPLGVLAGITTDARITLTPPGADTADITLTGSPMSLAVLLARSGDIVSFANSGVVIQGDETILRSVGHILQQLDIDWEQAMAGIIGDTPAHLAGEAIRNTGNWYKEASGRTASGIAEFVREESGMTLSRAEAESWFDGVRRAAADIDRLAARIDRLKRQRNH